MDFTKFNQMPCPACGKTDTLGGAGGHFGGRIMTTKIRCSSCGFTMLIVPMSEKYEYSLSATTAEERKEAYINNLKQENAVELEKRIALAQTQEF